jgi:hypothetical protein
VLVDEAVEVMVEAAASTAWSEACHQIGIPSQSTVIATSTECVVTVPRSSKVPAGVG